MSSMMKKLADESGGKRQRQSCHGKCCQAGNERRFPGNTAPPVVERKGRENRSAELSARLAIGKQHHIVQGRNETEQIGKRRDVECAGGENQDPDGEEIPESAQPRAAEQSCQGEKQKCQAKVSPSIGPMLRQQSGGISRLKRMERTKDIGHQEGGKTNLGQTQMAPSTVPDRGEILIFEKGNDQRSGNQQA